MGGVTLPAVERQAPPPTALTEHSTLTDRTAKQRHVDSSDEIDADTGEVIDAGEYAESDAEEQPGEAAVARKAVGGPRPRSTITNRNGAAIPGWNCTLRMRELQLRKRCIRTASTPTA